MKLYRNWIINEVARAMTKGEHTNEPYIPSTTLLCEEINRVTFCPDLTIAAYHGRNAKTTANMGGWMIAILRTFQKYFSHIRTMVEGMIMKGCVQWKSR